MTSQSSVVMTTDLPLPLFGRGKVRDSYDLGNVILIISTDRLSAFDSILPTGIPDKGAVLTQLSRFWFDMTKNIVPNHIVAMVDNDRRVLDNYVASAKRFNYPEYLSRRSMVVKKAKVIPYECVVRGYITGSAWDEYKKKGTVCGMSAPKGLQESQEFPEPVFTPTTKATSGHDMPITIEEMRNDIGAETANKLRDYTIGVYNAARKYALSRGIIIADTKLEFGMDNGKMILVDEVLTPDSSRFWDAALYKVGQSQPSYDKQFARDWLTQSGWNKEPPAPPLPPDITAMTAQKYRQAYEMLTGKSL